MNEKEMLDNILNAFAEKTNDKRVKLIQSHSKLFDNLSLILNNMVLADKDYIETTFNLFEQFNNICESYISEHNIDVKKLKNMFGE